MVVFINREQSVRLCILPERDPQKEGLSPEMEDVWSPYSEIKVRHVGLSGPCSSALFQTAVLILWGFTFTKPSLPSSTR